MERPALERRLTPCAEFPNDNQDLHHGSIWDWVTLCDVPVDELPSRRRLTRQIEEKPSDLETKPEAAAPKLLAAIPVPVAPIQVVSLLTILEGTPRDGGRTVRAEVEEVSEEIAVEPVVSAMNPEPVTEPAPEQAAPPVPAPIVSLLTILEGTPRYEGRTIFADVDGPVPEVAGEPAFSAVNPTPIAEDAPEEAVPAAPAPIVSLLTDRTEDVGVEVPLAPASEVASWNEWASSDSEVEGGDSIENDQPIEIVDDLAFDAIDDGTAEANVSEPGQADPFAQLVSALEHVARALGASDAAIASLEALLGQARLDARTFDDRTIDALVAGDMVGRAARGIARSQAFTAKVIAWQSILRGESEDFALPDGGALEPLDEWAADLLARIVGPPARADGVRRDLRRRGVAAFGLVADAA